MELTGRAELRCGGVGEKEEGQTGDRWFRCLECGVMSTRVKWEVRPVEIMAEFVQEELF